MLNRKNWYFYIGVPALGCLFFLLATTKQSSGKGTDPKDKASPVTPEQAIKQAHSDWRLMDRSKVQVVKYLKEAQKKKDIIRLNCVQEKLVKINTAMGLAKQVLGHLKLATKNAGASEHALWLYEKISIFTEQVQNLRREAEGCADEEVSYTGKTRVTLTIDPSIPRDDPTEPPRDAVSVGRPPEASPYI